MLVGRLRSIGVWRYLQRVHRLVAPPTCAVIHDLVEFVGPRFLPVDLVLKHHYDYVPVQVDPSTVRGLVPLRTGVGPLSGGLRGVVDRYRRWAELGGGWKCTQRHLTRNISGRFVADGDWDLERTPFKMVSSVVEIFVDDVPPQETEEYKKTLGRVEDRDLVWTRGFRTKQDVDDYFAQLVAVYNDIQTNGFRTQKELGYDGADEIRVCIDRNGDLNIFGGGTHRLSIALLLELDTVPVLVKRVHTRWVDRCMERYGGSVVSAISEGIANLGSDEVSDEFADVVRPVGPNQSADESPSHRRQSC